MTKKFHIIPATGLPGLCSAAKGNCPFGGQDEHYSTVEKAREAFEVSQKLELGGYRPPVLSDLLDPKEFAKCVRLGLITERAHEADENLRIYSYGKKVQYEGLWTRETMLARGLMLQLPENGVLADAQVVGRGLPKFFTIEQVDSDWGRVKLIDDDEGVTVEEAPVMPWEQEAIVSDKLNGALGLAYMAPDELPAVSTKGSFGSLEAAVATRVLREKYDAEALKKLLAGKLRGKTPLFEIITPERPHPIDYGDKEDVLLLGVMNNRTGHWAPAEDDSPLVTVMGFDRAQQLEVKTLREAVEAPYRANTEGLVVTVNDPKTGQHLYKVKPQEYLNLRKLFYATNPKELSSYVASISLDELKAIDEPSKLSVDRFVGVEANSYNASLIAKRNEAIFNELIEPVRRLATVHQAKVAAMLQANPALREDRRAFVDALKNVPGNKQLYFSAYDDALTGGDATWERARKLTLKTL